MFASKPPWSKYPMDHVLSAHPTRQALVVDPRPPWLGPGGPTRWPQATRWSLEPPCAQALRSSSAEERRSDLAPETSDSGKIPGHAGMGVEKVDTLPKLPKSYSCYLLHGHKLISFGDGWHLIIKPGRGMSLTPSTLKQFTFCPIPWNCFAVSKCFHHSRPIAFLERGTVGEIWRLWDHHDQTTILDRHFTVHVSRERHFYPNSCLDTD